MATLIIVTVLLSIAGGLIAFTGDRLGTRAGKRRWTILKLRPRHTATLLTVLSGIAIALLTLVVLLGISATFRRALLHGQEIAARNDELSAKNLQLEQGLAARQQQLTLRQQQLHAIGGSLIQAQQHERSALEKEEAAEQRRFAAQSDLQKVSSSLTQSLSLLSQRQTELSDARVSLADAQRKLGSTRGNLTRAQQAVTQAQTQVRLKIADVARAKSDYLREQGKVTDLVHQGRQLALRNSDLETKNERLVDDNVRLTTQHLIYRKEQELGRTVISANQSVGSIRNELVSFLEQTSDAAKTYGGKDGENGRAVILAPPSLTEATLPVNYSEDTEIDQLVESIHRQSGIVPGVVILADAKFNTFVGEQAQIQVHLYDNVLVFPKGTFIASTVIDGTQREDVILAALQNFLKQSVRPIARQHGVIPTRDPATGEFSVGQPTDSARTLALVKQIEEIGVGATVTATAVEDTYSSGPLRLRLSAAASVTPAAHTTTTSALIPPAPNMP